MLWEILWKNLARKSCGKNLQDILVGKSCGKSLRDREEGKKVNLREAVIGGNLAFGIG